jgi:hypothetical protein
MHCGTSRNISESLRAIILFSILENSDCQVDEVIMFIMEKLSENVEMNCEKIVNLIASRLSVSCFEQ